MIEGDLMANICNYEIHAKGNKKAVLFFYTTLQTLDYKQITHKEGSEMKIYFIAIHCIQEISQQQNLNFKREIITPFKHLLIFF